MFLLVCSAFAPAVRRCRWEAVGGLWGGPTHRNVSFQLYFKVFGFLSADLAEWFDFAVIALSACVYQSIKKGHRELKF